MAVKSGEQKGVPAGRKNPSRNAFVPCICSPLSLDALAGVSPAPPRGICVHLKVWYTESMKKQSIESIYELLPEEQPKSC